MSKVASEIGLQRSPQRSSEQEEGSGRSHAPPTEAARKASMAREALLCDTCSFLTAVIFPCDAVVSSATVSFPPSLTVLQPGGGSSNHDQTPAPCCRGGGASRRPPWTEPMQLALGIALSPPQAGPTTHIRHPPLSSRKRAHASAPLWASPPSSSTKPSSAARNATEMRGR